MRRARNSGLRTSLLFGIGLTLALGLTACEEDTTVNSSLEGKVTLDEPYIIQPGLQYSDIPIEKGGTLFLIAEDVPAGFNDLTTASAVDINLVVAGFSNFFGETAGGSFTEDSGNESYGVLGDDESELYFQVEGGQVLTSGATFDLVIDSSAAPAPITIANLPACTPTVPSPSCTMTGQVMDSPFAVAPDAPLTVSIDVPGFPYNVFLRTTDCSNCGGGSYVPFPGNDAGFYGDGYCHANSDYWGGSISSPGSCVINPVPTFAPPIVLTVANNTSSSGFDVTLAFTSP